MTVKEICENIEREYRLLAELTGVNYITGTLLDGTYMMWSDKDKRGKKPIDIFNSEVKENE
jgi:hypothetical protein